MKKQDLDKEKAYNNAYDRWKHHMDERGVLFNVALESSKLYSKALLTLSGGALTLTLAYVRDFVENPIFSSLLIISWALFVITILITTFSFFIGQLAYEKQIALNEDHYAKNEERISKNATPFPPLVNPYGFPVRALDMVALSAFGIALTLIITFVAINMRTSERPKKGEVMHVFVMEGTRGPRTDSPVPPPAAPPPPPPQK